MTTATKQTVDPDVLDVDRVTIRFAGDSGDGMQLTGTQFTKTSAVFGNDISTVPDIPAEIRAPQGSLPGVSAFQVSFSSYDIYTPGDRPDVLVAMNPAALKVHLQDLPKGGIVIVNSDEFNSTNLKKAGYESNPLEDNSLQAYRLFQVAIGTLNARALKSFDLSSQEVDRSKNMFALGLMFWMYSRPLDVTIKFINDRFGRRNPKVAEANIATLKAGYYYGETTEAFAQHYHVPKAKLAPGLYRNVTGNEATALGFLTASKLAGRPLFYGSYPITPASEILHQLAAFKRFGVKTFQAEDEIAAIGSAIGAAFGGSLGMTGTSGPGIALKSEAIGLAVMVELPLVVIDVQRSGPSTGIPTKTEQGDLLQCMFGRNSVAPVAIVAPSTSSDCFEMAIEAWRIAIKYRTPVIFLSDLYLGVGSEPWLIPDYETLPKMEPNFASDPATFKAYER
ncbi:MAG TPA: 2-oxoacid:acceptor oxidoreductase family protein, partial [Dehalococcoidia bacterium]|nr:2-oxoacid:acceptor oxidoreductase family protein [Dehalococcoidia bacterium]